MADPSMIELAFLRRLDAGVPYAQAVNACGPQGLKVAFNCTLQGWVSASRITAEGLKAIMPVVTIVKE